MSCTNFHSVTQRYCTVRQNLDGLGYKQAFSLDSLPLIELLLFDLAQTKENLEYYESLASNKKQTCSELQVGIEPYKCDNAKLVQECNQVHLELIKAKEENLRQSYDYKKRIRKLESEQCDLQKSFSRSLQRIRQLEIEISNKTRKITELLGKCNKKSNFNNFSLETNQCSCKSLRKTKTLEAESYSKLSNFGASSDFENMADQRITHLSNEIKKLKEDLFLSNECVEMLKSEIIIKEKEMNRLRQMLEGGRPCTAISKDHDCQRSDKSKSSIELKCLQKEKMNLEQQLKEALNMQHEAVKQAMQLAERNEQLEKQLKSSESYARSESNSSEKESNKRFCKLQEKLEDVMSQVHMLESELTVQRREAQELRADLEACRLEKCSVQRALETTLEEKKRMTDKMNNLTAMEKKDTNCKVDDVRKEIKSLGMKICELKQINKGLKQAARPKLTPTKPNNRQSCGVNNQPVSRSCGVRREPQSNCNARKKSPAVASKGPDRGRSPERRMPDQCSRNCRSSSCACKKDSGDSDQTKNNTDKQIREKNVIIDSLQNTIERLETERDRYRDDFCKLKQESRKDSNEDDRNELWTQICELQAQMSEKEHMILKLIREKKDVCQEKSSLETKLKSVQNRHSSSSSHNACSCGGYTNSDDRRPSSCLHKKVEKLEQELACAKADIERLCEERDCLRDRLKLATTTHVSEQCRLRTNLADVESRLARVERERNELLCAQGSRRAALNSRDDQLEDLKEELTRTKEELCQQRTQYYQLRTLQDQTDQALSDVQSQLTQFESELSSALDRNKNLECLQIQSDNQVKELKEEINTHRCKIAQLDREKDQLLMDLDEKTEKIANLERELCFKEQKLSEVGQQVQEVQHSKQNNKGKTSINLKLGWACTCQDQ